MLLLAALAAPGVAGCRSARHRAETDVVRDIRFDGNGGFFSGHNDYQLHTQMLQRASRFGLLVWPLVYTVDPRTLDPDVLARDAYRLEVWYAHRGWFDARVMGWNLVRVRAPHRRRAAVFDVHGVIDPGPQSTVRQIVVDGLPPALDGIRNATLRRASIRVGDPFDLTYVQETRDALLGKLLDHAHPYATVDMAIAAFPEERAVDVTYATEPGIAGRIGPISVEGTNKVPEAFVREAAELTPGDPYALDALREAQRRLFDMGTFSVVTVEPDLSDPARADVPIAIRVGETKFRTFRVGAGVTYDSYLPVVRASARIRHVNLLHQLIRAELGAAVGLALEVASAEVSPTTSTPPGTGGSTGTGSTTLAVPPPAPSQLRIGGTPTWSVDLSFVYPRLLGGKASIELAGKVEQDVYSGLWTYRRPVVDLGFVYAFTHDASARIGPHFENYVFLEEFGELVSAAQQRLFGIETDGPFEYRLTALDQSLTVDRRNDPVRTTRGSTTSVVLREAVPVTDIGYGFVKAAVEHRHYLPLRAADRGSAFPLTLAARGKATVIVPYGATTAIPLPERAFLGGATSLRGFRPNQVGPYSTLCTYTTVTSGGGFLGLGGAEPVTEERLVQYWLPAGGTVAAELDHEIRYDWAYGVTLASFVDLGLLAETLAEAASWDAVRGSVGIGARYDTIAGPLRFDLSFRPSFPEDLGPRGRPLCRPGDGDPRVSDFFDNFSGLRGDEHPPFAMVFYLTFGEAL